MLFTNVILIGQFQTCITTYSPAYFLPIYIYYDHSNSENRNMRINYSRASWSDHPAVA